MFALGLIGVATVCLVHPLAHLGMGTRFRAFIGVALGVAGGYTAFVVALRTGELSYVATFRYAGIPMAMLLGLLVWGDLPSAGMLAGAALIMGAGVFIVWHERRRKG